MSVKAKRGQWLVVERTERTFYIGQASEERTRVDLLEVTSCTREGFVKECKDARGYINNSWMTSRALVITAEQVASEDVRRAALAHHYPNHPGQPMPFDSVEQVREALRPYRLAPATT